MNLSDSTEILCILSVLVILTALLFGKHSALSALQSQLQYYSNPTDGANKLQSQATPDIHQRRYRAGSPSTGWTRLIMNTNTERRRETLQGMKDKNIFLKNI